MGSAAARSGEKPAQGRADLRARANVQAVVSVYANDVAPVAASPVPQPPVARDKPLGDGKRISRRTPKTAIRGEFEFCIRNRGSTLSPGTASIGDNDPRARLRRINRH